MWAVKARHCPGMGLVSDAAGATWALISPTVVPQGSTKRRLFSQWDITKSTTVHWENLAPGLCGQHLSYCILFGSKVWVKYHFNGKRLPQGFHAGTCCHKSDRTWLLQWFCFPSPFLGTSHPDAHTCCPMDTSHACAHCCQANSKGLPPAGKEPGSSSR